MTVNMMIIYWLWGYILNHYLAYMKLILKICPLYFVLFSRVMVNYYFYILLLDVFLSFFLSLYYNIYRSRGYLTSGAKGIKKFFYSRMYRFVRRQGNIVLLDIRFPALGLRQTVFECV